MSPPDYSKLPGNRSPETMRGVVVPLQPVTDEHGRPAQLWDEDTKAARRHTTVLPTKERE